MTYSWYWNDLLFEQVTTWLSKASNLIFVTILISFLWTRSKFKSREWSLIASYLLGVRCLACVGNLWGIQSAFFQCRWEFTKSSNCRFVPRQLSHILKIDKLYWHPNRCWKSFRRFLDLVRLSQISACKASDVRKKLVPWCFYTLQHRRHETLCLWKLIMSLSISPSLDNKFFVFKWVLRIVLLFGCVLYRI